MAIKIILYIILAIILIAGLLIPPRYYEWKARKPKEKEPPAFDFDKYLEELRKRFPDYFKNPQRTIGELPLEIGLLLVRGIANEATDRVINRIVDGVSDRVVSRLEVTVWQVAIVIIVAIIGAILALS